MKAEEQGRQLGSTMKPIFNLILADYKKNMIKRVLEIIDKKEIFKWIKKDLVVIAEPNKQLERLVSLITKHIKEKIKEEFK